MRTKMPEGKAKGGIARAEAMSPEKRKEQAEKAAKARWDKTLVQASHEGEFPIGQSVLSCANLPGGKRIITQATFLRALGRSRSPKAGTGVLSTVDGLPFFLSANSLKPFIDEELARSTQPIFYKSKKGGKGVGYDATLLPKVAEVYLRLRDQSIAENGEVPKQYEHIIKAADILMRGLAHVGIIALVDEATGYQKDRTRDELAKILEAFVAKELQPYVRAFPPEFYEHMFKLRGLPFPGNGVKRPQYFGHLTNDIIYRRLAPGVWKELKEQTEKDEKGRLKYHLHRKLTPDLGHPKLKDLVTSVVTVMKLSDNWGDFKNKLDRVHPAYNETMLLPFDLENDSGKGI
jgi:P63C domain